MTDDPVKAGVGTDSGAGTTGKADAGVDGGDAHADVGVGAGAHAGVDAHASAGGDVDGTAHAGVEAHADAEGSGSVGDHGVSAQGNLSAGYGVDAGAGGTVHAGRSKGALASDVSIGPQIGVSGGAHATVKDGVISVGETGDVAAGLGLKGDINIDIDTRPIKHAANEVWDETFGHL